MNLVFGVLHHLFDALQIKIRKVGDKKFFVFSAGNIFWPIFRVICVINELGFRFFASFLDAFTARKKNNNRKIGNKVFSLFTAGSIF